MLCHRARELIEDGEKPAFRLRLAELKASRGSQFHGIASVMSATAMPNNCQLVHTRLCGLFVM